MSQMESLAWIVYQDRVRDIDRRVRVRRLLEPDDDELTLSETVARPVAKPAAGDPRRQVASGSAAEPA